MALPSITAEIAFDSGFATAEGDRTWTDVSEYVEQAVDITYGRADELSTPDPNRLSLTLDNRDGRFTPGKSSSPYYPNVKKGKPVRVSVRYAEDGSGNFLSANAASFETSVAAWSAGGSVPPTLAQSSTHVDNGSQAMRITWGTGGSFPLAQTTVSNLVVGRIYTAQARVWVTAGTPDIKLAVAGIGTGTATSTKSAFATISFTFTATAASHLLQVWPNSAPTAGQQCWVDSVMVDEGSSTGTFTTSAPPSSVRFTGYIDEWPLVWPGGTAGAANVTVTASSRRARLGQTAPLTSAIRAAYLATNPDAYWPMDDELQNNAGIPVFRDITNTAVNLKQTQSIGAWNSATTQPIVLNDDGPRPTDEAGLVKIPAFTDSALIGTYVRYVGGGGVTRINTAGNATIETVARVSLVNDPATVIVFEVLGDNLGTVASMYVSTDAGSGLQAVIGDIFVTDADTGAVLDFKTSGSAGSTPTQYQAAIDGELHHYAMTLSGGTVLRYYFDGALLATLTLTTATMSGRPLGGIALGSTTYRGNLWVGHAATHDRALTADEIAAHAAAATSATETVEERVVRVAGRIGVPADEIDVETSIAGSLGPQPEAGRSASEVIDEAATSAGGVLYDTREGHLALASRDSRYNVAAAFTLDAAAHEIESDLTVTDDHRYTINTVEFSRSGVEDSSPATVTDEDSIDAYGIFAQSYSVVAESDTEVEVFAQDRLYRYADPDPRVSQISVSLNTLSDAQRRLVLSADIGTRFGMASLASQAPTDPMHVFFEGATESITADSHTMTINTTPGDIYQDVFVWDDATKGKWDSGNVWAY